MLRQRPSSPVCRSRGTTLLEPLVLTTVLGTLAAAALPNLVDTGRQAQAAALRGVAAAAGSAMYVNQGACLVAARNGAAVRCLPVRSCGDVAALFVGGIPEGYAMEGGSGPGARPGDEFACTVTQAGDRATAAFRGIVSGD
jgi:hypothetical protein